jgi:peptidoglycan/xylan/chitin deacetylase (PgdA/CDA1 family)
MDVLLACAQPLRAEVKFVPHAGKRYVVVTFDDAFESVVHNAVPELVSRGIPATIFVVTDSLGKLPTWGEYGHSPAEEKLMTVEQLLSLPSDLITFGSHTRTHPILTRLSEQQARREIVESRAALEELLGKKITTLSFPHGVFDETVLRLCQDAGYERVFTILPTLGLRQSNEYATGRVWAEPDDWSLEFRLKVVGAYRWLPTAFALKRAMTSNKVLRRVLSGRSKPMWNI